MKGKHLIQTWVSGRIPYALFVPKREPTMFISH